MKLIILGQAVGTCKLHAEVRIVEEPLILTFQGSDANRSTTADTNKGSVERKES